MELVLDKRKKLKQGFLTVETLDITVTFLESSERKLTLSHLSFLISNFCCVLNVVDPDDEHDGLKTCTVQT